MSLPTRLRWSLPLPLALAAACSKPTVPVLEPIPRTGDGGPPSPAAPAMESAVRVDLGKFPDTPAPRWGVVVFSLPREEDAEAPPSIEWSARVLSRLDWQGVAATGIEIGDATLAGDWEPAVRAVAARVGARDVDLLLTGAIGTGGGPRVHLFAVDTRTGHVAARSEFEGRYIDRVLDEAVKDAIRSATQYWTELHRGEDVAPEVTVRGLRTDAGVTECHQALAAIPDVHLARHHATRVEGGARTAVFTLFFHGEAARLSDRLATTTWTGASGRVRLWRQGDFELEARYAEPR